MPAGFLQQRENETMQNTIENNKNSLANLLIKVQDQASRNADYLAPLKDLQNATLDQKINYRVASAREWQNDIEEEKLKIKVKSINKDLKFTGSSLFL